MLPRCNHPLPHRPPRPRTSTSPNCIRARPANIPAGERVSSFYLRPLYKLSCRSRNISWPPDHKGGQGRRAATARLTRPHLYGRLACTFGIVRLCARFCSSSARLFLADTDEETLATTQKILPLPPLSENKYIISVYLVVWPLHHRSTLALDSDSVTRHWPSWISSVEP